MKTFALLTSLAATALAQNVFVNLPEGPNIAAGSDVIVQVTRPNSLTGSREIAVAIGIQPCYNGRCLPAESTLGTVLYNGPYTPQIHEWSGLPYENFTVTVPTDLAKGTAIVGVAHATLIGAANWAFLEVVNATATVV
ncbi:hypothetical protein BJY01DRAFT_247331 [Aspergillus pseudoustus]|uniref:Uncharacterized protein n=1 Tax=Aspergillus pseudoustus TaxID=1810923 RepID=A0ABR4K1S6_9EURO